MNFLGGGWGAADIGRVYVTDIASSSLLLALLFSVLELVVQLLDC